MLIDINNPFNDFSTEYMVEKPCPNCGRLVKQKISKFQLRMNYGVVGSVYCDNCKRENDEKEAAEQRRYNERYPFEDCPSCHGSGRIDGYTCAECMGKGKIRSSQPHYS